MKFKISSLFLLFAIASCAQEKEPIEADRPDQSETPSIVPKGMFQVETGFSYQKNDMASESFALPSVLWKYGLNDNVELRLITEFVLDKNSGMETSGFNPVVIGCKIRISEEKGVIPKTSFLGHLSLPNAASAKYKTDFYAPEFRFSMQHSLDKKLTLSYNLGAEWDGFSAEPTFIYTLSTGYSISEKLDAYLEVFGFAPQNDSAEHNLDAGFTYLVSNDFMVDVSSGLGITDNAPHYYFAAGCSFRL